MGKALNNLLVTCMMLIKLSHCILMILKMKGYVKNYNGKTK